MLLSEFVKNSLRHLLDELDLEGVEIPDKTMSMRNIVVSADLYNECSENRYVNLLDIVLGARAVITISECSGQGRGCRTSFMDDPFIRDNCYHFVIDICVVSALLYENTAKKSHFIYT